MTTSVLILTLNEEMNIGPCLDSLSWSDDIVVLDSLSTDKTVQIAESKGARVVQRRFDDYASQRNFGMHGISYYHPWLLMVDADERVPPELQQEIAKTLNTVDNETTLFAMRRKDYLFGKWIRRSGMYPTWFGRLVRPSRTWVERSVNEEYKTDGRVAQLREHLDHYPFNKGFSAWIDKHNRYSTMEAALMFGSPRPRAPIAELISRDPQIRRRRLTQLLERAPARPLIIFIAIYFIRGGILEGRAGLTFSLLRAWYEFMIDCKRRELLSRQAFAPI